MNGGAGNLLTFVSFCDKNMGVLVICSAGYSPENLVIDGERALFVNFLYNNLLSESFSLCDVVQGWIQPTSYGTYDSLSYTLPLGQ